MGVDYQTAIRMGFSRAVNLVTARNETMRTSDGDGVRDATQGDIQKFMCG